MLVDELSRPGDRLVQWILEQISHDCGCLSRNHDKQDVSIVLGGFGDVP